MTARIEAVRYCTEQGWTTALAFWKRTLIHLVVIRPPVSEVTAPLTDERYMRPLSHHGAPYPIARAAKRLRRAGRLLGITKAARKLLKEAT